MSPIEADRFRDPRGVVLQDLIGESPGVVLLRQQVIHLLSRQSPSRRLPTLLIQGETGTGKGLLARAVHNVSVRSSQPFVDADCVAIPETLLEAELFGFERGAFTDAKQPKLGLFQAASHGTIFLDEVGLLPRSVQAKLLKVVEERGVRRLGSTHVDVLDLWIIAATNVDLAAATREGTFREDLYHRLAAMTLYMPPLRERGADVLLLAGHFLARACIEYRLPVKVLTQEAQAALLAYPWPGNVRELANMLERVALLSGDVSVITPDLLGLYPHAGRVKSMGGEPERSELKVSIEGFEREKLRAVLRETGWNISLAAARLGLPRNTLRYRIAKLALTPAKSVAVVEAGRKPSDKVGERPRKVGPAWTEGTWQRPRGVYLAASVSQAGAESGEVSRILERIAEKVRRFGGRVEAMTDAELLASFGFDNSMHEAPACAANAALAVQRASVQGYLDGSSSCTVQLTVQGFTAQARDEARPPHTNGRPLQREGETAGLLLGPPASAAILVAADAARLLHAQFELEPVAAPADGQDSLYRLVSRRQRVCLSRGQPLAPFVGREHELAMLDALLDQAERGRGQAVGIVGEPGAGKSRLLLEFRQRAVQRGFAYREARCFPSHGAMVNDALNQMLQQAYEIGEDDSPELICEKVRQGVEEVGLDPDEWAPYLLRATGIRAGTERLSGLNRETIRIRTFEILRRIMLERSRRAPLVIAIDDLHLAGRTAEEFLLYVDEELPSSRILLLTTYRPGYRLPWGDRAHVSQFGLQPLSRGTSWLLLRRLLPVDQPSNDLIHRILDSAQGNPLFLEELARDAATRQGEGDALSVTDAIQSTLLPRMSRLSDGARRVLVSVSVIGERAPVRLVEHVLGRPRRLDFFLAEARKHDLLREVSGGGETVLVFNHPLMGRAIYESLSVEERRSLHAAVGAALEELHAGRLQGVYDLLAYHYGRSADSAKAIAYLPHLILSAGQNSSLLDSVAALSRALEHAACLPAGAQRDRLIVDLVTRQAHALVKVGQLRGARDLLLRHLSCVENLNNPQFAGAFFLALAGAYGFLGEAAPAAMWVRRATDEAGRSGDATTLHTAEHGLALDCLWAGRFGEGIEHGRARAVTRLGKRRDQWWGGQALWGKGMNRIVTGHLNQAIEIEEAAWEVARETGDTRLECFTAFAKGWAHSLRGDWKKGLAACRRAVELAPDPLATALAQGWLGAACLEMEDWEQAACMLFQAYDQFLEWKCRPPRALVCAWLSDALVGRGQYQRAQELASEGLALSENLGFPLAEALTRRALGRIAQARGALVEAEDHLQGAHLGFQSIGAAYEGARTLLDLAVIAEASGRLGVAATHMAAARKTFSNLSIAFYSPRPIMPTASRQGSRAEG